MYPSLPLYASVPALIKTAQGASPEADKLSNCQYRLFVAVPAVCYGIEPVLQLPSTWTCSKSCASQLVDALEYCKTTSVLRFHTPVAVTLRAQLSAKVSQWESYAALGAVHKSEPDVYGVIPNDEHNLVAQDIPTWYQFWYAGFRGSISMVQDKLATMKAKCKRTTANAEALRAAAAANPGSVQQIAAMRAETTIEGVAISKGSLLRQLEAQHGAGNAQILSFVQESKLGFALPGSVADFDSSTAKGLAARYMVQRGAAQPVGCHADNVTILAVGSLSRRRALQASGGTVSVNLTIMSPSDVSSTLGGSNFSTEFASAYVAAAQSIPSSISSQLSFAEMAVLVSRAKSVSDVSATITLTSDTSSVYGDAMSQAAFDAAAKADIASLCGISPSRVIVDGVSSGSLVVTFRLLAEAASASAPSAPLALSNLRTAVAAGTAQVGGVAAVQGSVVDTSTSLVSVAPSYTTTVVIEVRVPPGMLADDAAELVDRNAVLALLAAAGVDLAGVTISTTVVAIAPAPAPAADTNGTTGGGAGGSLVTNTLTDAQLSGALAGLSGAGSTNAADTAIDLPLPIFAAGAAVFTALVGAYICLFVIGKKRSRRWAKQMQQVVPTGLGAKKAKKLKLDLQQQWAEAIRNPSPPISEVMEGDEEGDEVVGMSRAQMLIANMSPEQIEEVKETFLMFDRDGSGSIDAKELRAAMRALGQEYTKKETKEIIEGIDEDGNGEIDIDEFCVLMAPFLLAAEEDAQNSRLTHEQLEQIQHAFEHYDADGSGEIDAKELCAAMRELGNDIMAEDCVRLIETVDEDGSGTIDINEFAVMMAPMIIQQTRDEVESAHSEEEGEEELGGEPLLEPRPPSAPAPVTGRRGSRRQKQQARREAEEQKVEQALARGIIEALPEEGVWLTKLQAEELDAALAAEAASKAAEDARMRQRKQGLKKGLGGSKRTRVKSVSGQLPGQVTALDSVMF